MIAIASIAISVLALVLCLVTQSWYSGLEKRIDRLEKRR